ncbi:hypothetical protein FACS1894186_6500 [Alphaproteobacteria bacterium]|nr:hypothetical protein FACS1894186_6500 [Alphaproteobacteria bacterium]
MALSPLEAKELAGRYGAAIVAAGGAEADGLARQASSLAEALRDKSLSAAMANPCVPRRAKAAVLAEVAGRLGVGKVMGHALAVLAESGRASIAPLVLADVAEKLASRDGSIAAVARAAWKLNPAEIKELEKALADRCGRPVRLEAKHDPSVIAGLEITVAGVRYDLTLAGSLARLKLDLADIRKDG